MSDSVVFSITTSPPPVQVVKPAQTVSTSETRFEDVLRAQTELSQPREKTQVDRNTASAEPPMEAAKSNQPSTVDEPKGESKPLNENKDQKNEEGDSVEEVHTSATPIVYAEVQPVPAIAAPVLVDEVRSETQVLQSVTEPAQPIPSAVAPLPVDLPAQSILTPAPASEGQTQPVKIDSGKSASFEEQLQQANAETGTNPQPVATAAVTTKPESEANEAAIQGMANAPKDLQAASTKEGALANDFVAETKQGADLRDGKVESKSTPSLTVADPVVDQAKAPPAQSHPQNTSTPAENELKANLDKSGISVQVEKTEPKQVQAPPGQTQVEAVAITGKTIEAPSTNQIIEPARLAEAQTADMIGQITRQLDKLQQSGRTTFRLQLSPQDLGQIDLKITSTQHGIGVTILAENGATSKLLETQVAQLRQSLMDAGVQINNLHVGTQGSQSNQSQTSSNYPQNQHQRYANQSEKPVVNDPIVTRAGQTLVDYKI